MQFFLCHDFFFIYPTAVLLGSFVASDSLLSFRYSTTHPSRLKNSVSPVRPSEEGMRFLSKHLHSIFEMFFINKLFKKRGCILMVFSFGDNQMLEMEFGVDVLCSTFSKTP